MILVKSDEISPQWMPEWLIPTSISYTDMTDRLKQETSLSLDTEDEDKKLQSGEHKQALSQPQPSIMASLGRNGTQVRAAQVSPSQGRIHLLGWDVCQDETSIFLIFRNPG